MSLQLHPREVIQEIYNLVKGSIGRDFTHEEVMSYVVWLFKAESQRIGKDFETYGEAVLYVADKISVTTDCCNSEQVLNALSDLIKIGRIKFQSGKGYQGLTLVPASNMEHDDLKQLLQRPSELEQQLRQAYAKIAKLEESLRRAEKDISLNERLALLARAEIAELKEAQALSEIEIKRLENSLSRATAENAKLKALMESAEATASQH